MKVVTPSSSYLKLPISNINIFGRVMMLIEARKVEKLTHPIET